MIWEVFARKAYEDPLHHVGTVTEADDQPHADDADRDLRVLDVPERHPQASLDAHPR